MNIREMEQRFAPGTYPTVWEHPATVGSETSILWRCWWLSAVPVHGAGRSEVECFTDASNRAKLYGFEPGTARFSPRMISSHPRARETPMSSTNESPAPLQASRLRPPAAEAGLPLCSHRLPRRMPCKPCWLQGFLQDLGTLTLDGANSAHIGSVPWTRSSRKVPATSKAVDYHNAGSYG